ncbi:MAG: ATP-binding protein [Proteobacteria bacterium]|nr:ATP-binding protein [Pseudomonadota bacterium]
MGIISSPVTTSNYEIPAILFEINHNNIDAPILSKDKAVLIEDLLREWKFEECLKAKGITPRNTILIYGPSGCGKTHLASYIAKSLHLRLFAIRFDSLISSYLGETGNNIRKAFEFILANRCVLFIDEMDAIAKRRDDQNELGELKRIVITLLQNLDTKENKSILIAATNHPHMLDPAIWRRFEFILELLPPKSTDRMNLFSFYLGQQIPDSIKEDLIFSTDGFTGSDILQICNNAKRKFFINNHVNLLLDLSLSILDYLKRIPLNEPPKKLDEKKLTAALCIKKLDGESFSFHELEDLSGIPHSTLHNRYKQLQGVRNNGRSFKAAFENTSA